MPSDEDTRPTCFIAMPITTHDPELYGGDEHHWSHVMETLFVKAVELAGFRPIVPVARGSVLIHAEIVRHLENADMVLCDLSSHNENVFFELGVRTSLDKPIALVKDELTTISFDTGGLNTHAYKSSLPSWEIDREITTLRQHIEDAALSCAGRNPMWQHFGLTQRAQQPAVTDSPRDAQLQLIFEGMNDLRGEVARLGTSGGLSVAGNATTVHGEPRVQMLGKDLAVALGAGMYTSAQNGAEVSFTYPALFTNRDPAREDAAVQKALRAASKLGFRQVSMTREDSTLGLTFAIDQKP